jgi:hypothetical protein
LGGVNPGVNKDSASPPDPELRAEPQASTFG